MELIVRLVCNVAAVLAVSTGALAGCSSAPAADEPVVHATEAPTFGTSADGWPAGTVDLETADGTVHRITVRIAEEPKTRRQGLMDVEEVPPGNGMLFLWDGSPREGAFWMKDTRVPLDIAYVRAGEIVDIQRMEPCTEYEDASRDCPSYPPAAPYDTALEVRAGWFGGQGIAVGDQVTVER